MYHPYSLSHVYVNTTAYPNLPQPSRVQRSQPAHEVLQDNSNRSDFCPLWTLVEGTTDNGHLGISLYLLELLFILQLSVSHLPNKLLSDDFNALPTHPTSKSLIQHLATSRQLTNIFCNIFSQPIFNTVMMMMIEDNGLFCSSSMIMCKKLLGLEKCDTVESILTLESQEALHCCGLNLSTHRGHLISLILFLIFKKRMWRHMFFSFFFFLAPTC